MSKNLSAKYYHGNIEKLQEKALKKYQKKKKKKKNNMVVNIIKISQKMKSKSLLCIEKNIIESEKTIYYNYKKVF